MAAENQPAVRAFLHRHEQMSAWVYFSLMSFLVIRYGIAGSNLNGGISYSDIPDILYLTGHSWMEGKLPYSHLSSTDGPLPLLLHGIGSLLTPCSLFGAQLIYAFLLGVWLLYALKTCALYVRRSTAWALTGILFIPVLGFSTQPAEMLLPFQQVTLYHLLVWSRGRKDTFQPRHLALAGIGMGAALATQWDLALFWLPILPLMLLANRRHLVKSALILAGGLLLPLLPFLVYFHTCGILDSVWQAYILAPAPAYADFPLIRAASNLLPLWLMSLPGVLLLTAWVAPTLKGRPRRRYAVAIVLGAAWLPELILSFIHPPFHTLSFFIPYSLLSLIAIAQFTSRWLNRDDTRIYVRMFGLMAPMLVLMAALSIPLCLSISRADKGVTEWQDNITAFSGLFRQEPSTFLISDTPRLASIYRRTGTLPPGHYLTPPPGTQSEQRFRDDLTQSLLTTHPTYLLSTTADAPRAIACLTRAQMDWEATDLQALGMPAFPPAATLPAPVLYRINYSRYEPANHADDRHE